MTPLATNNNVPKQLLRSTPIAWDPSCPGKLGVYGNDSSSSDKRLNTLWSDQGNGANKFERTALIKVIQAHSDSFNFQKRIDGARSLGQTCREAVYDCLAEWEKSMQSDDNNNNPTSNNSESTNLELLKLSLAVLHLSDIFLPLLRPHYNYASSQYQVDPFSRPGIVTAPLVRFLRYHFNTPALMHPDVPNMLASEQPQHFGDDSKQGGEDNLYWRYIKSCAARGCLEQVWDALERHALYQTACATVEDTSQASTDSYKKAEHVIHVFGILKSVLCRAPLPGGRTDEYDDAVELNLQEGTDSMMDDDIVNLSGLRVEPRDFHFWELEPRTRSMAQPTGAGELPVNVAKKKLDEWQAFVRDNLLSNFSLSSIVQELRGVLEIVTGDFSSFRFDSWADEMCAHLIYKMPTLKPGEVHKVAMKFMEKHSVEGGELGSEDHIFLHIMLGKASHAIETLYALGGSSGAALPSTLLAVIYTMYLDLDILPPESGMWKFQFLCSAATDIISSLSDAGDTATSLALQLLVSVLKNEEEDIHSDEIRLCIVHILEHYYPQSDAGLQDCLGLISSVLPESGARRIKKGNHLPLFEACESVVLCRYRHYMSQRKPGIAVQKLSEGIQFRHRAGAVEGACYRTLCALCISASIKLLRILTGEQPNKQDDHAHAHKDAEEMMETIENLSKGSQDFPLSDIDQVHVFGHISKLFDSFVIDRDHAEAARHIIRCIEENSDDSGTVGRFLPLSLHWPLLLVAQQILRGEESTEAHESVAFNQYGISCLLQSLSQIVKISSSAAETNWGPTKGPDEVSGMQVLLAKALARACVAENAKKKRQPKPKSAENPLTSDLGSMDSSQQNDYAQKMLDL